MTRTRGGSSVGADSGRKPGLSTVGHKQMMDLFRVAEESSNPDIRNAALKQINELGKFERSQGARVSPALVVLLSTLLVVVAVAASWYAITHYSGSLASQIVWVVFIALGLILSLYALLSGHLSGKEFVRIVESAWSSIRRVLPWSTGRDKSSSEEP